jgi:hypothetical protein
MFVNYAMVMGGVIVSARPVFPVHLEESRLADSIQKGGTHGSAIIDGTDLCGYE